MKRPTMFLNRVLLNEGLQVNVSVERDVQEIERRFENEGMSFLTITLPSLDEALVQGLVLGRITPSMFNGFKPFKRGGKLPAMLAGFFMRVFELDGSLKEHPCIDSIRAIRQVARAFKKVELPCSAARVKQAFERYVSNDEDVLDTTPDDALFRIISSYLWSDLEDFSGELFCSPGVFGTGSTAERLAFNQRHSVRQWPERSENSFPVAYHGVSREDDYESFAGLEFIPEGDEPPVRVVQVPKTLKTPRIISVEPSYMMLMQQSIAKPLMAWLESEHFQFQSIRFRDQSHNRDQARLGSIDGRLATIDLKDASDMVSNDLVCHTFSSCPSFLELIQDCRSRSAKLPGGSVIKLRKFASMGSALCFPIEAMVFFTVVMYSIVRQSGRVPSRKLLSDIAANVSVYGDDIIVPAETAAGVMDDLGAYGLKVNHDKSFTTGLFRESCGGDYYAGEDITPVYVRRWDFTGNIRDPNMIEAYVSLSNQLYLKGLWHASQYIRDHFQRTRRIFPRATMQLGCVCYASVSFNTGLHYDPKLHAYRVRSLSLRVGRREDPVTDIRAGMLVCFGTDFIRDRLRVVSSKARRSYEPELCEYPGNPWNLAQRLSNTESLRWHYYSVTSGNQDRLRRVEYESNRLRHLDGSFESDLLTSVDSYVSNMKRRWAPTRVGLPSW